MRPKKNGKKWQKHSKRPRGDENEQGRRGNNSGGSAHESGEQFKRPRRAAAMVLGNVKGHQAVVGTCDIRNDRQATAELVDLLNAIADDMYPAAEEDEDKSAGGEDGAGTTTADTDGKAGGGGVGGDGPESDMSAPTIAAAAVAAAGAAVAPAAAGTAPSAPEKSLEDMIQEEADAMREGSGKTHRFKSVKTNVKGVVMVCVMDPKLDILRLVDALYDEIRTTKVRRSRFLERVTPLQVTAYPDIEAFKEAVAPIVSAGLPPVAKGVPPLPIVIRAAPAANPDGKKAEPSAEATASKETPAAEAGAAPEAPAAAPTAVAAEATSERMTEKNSAAGAADAADGAADKVGSDSGKGAAPAAAASGNGARSGRSEEGGPAAAGDGTKISDKRWKYRVDIRRRNSALQRSDLINAVVGSVGEGHSVSMSDPEVTIVIEAIKSIVGASVLFNYALNHEYSISRLQDAVCGTILDS